MLDNDDSFITDYLAESREHLADIETDLLAIEAGGAAIDEKLVNKVFRAAHSIKGGAGFFNLSVIQELAHRTENVLDLIRSHEMAPAPDVINILLMSFDRLRELINNHSESQQADTSELVVALSGLVSAHLSPSQKSSLVKMVKVTAPGIKAVFNIPEFDFNRAKEGDKYLYLVEFDLIDDVQRHGKRPTDVIYILTSCGTLVDAIFEIESAGTLDDEPSNRLPFYVLFSTELSPDMTDALFDVPDDQVHLVHAPVYPGVTPPMEQEKLPVVERPEVKTQLPVVAPLAQTPPSIFSPQPAAAVAEAVVAAATSETTLRVEVGVLESLMNLASELVLSRNQLLEAIASNDRRGMQVGAQRISTVTSELQGTIMLTRLQPIGNIFNKFPRVVRDLSRELGKEINLDINGRDVEMDKTIIEGLSEPLTHMVRNAVDHGIESSEQRARSGKPMVGTVRLKAYHEAGQVVVEISDDGKGIDPHAIGSAAVAKGLITQEHFKAMSEKEMTALIFMPGLSTAEKVSGISGRGVGMDVVKTNLDKLGGKIEIDSQIGLGTRFIIQLPLTLAIIPSLMVSANDERYAIPQIHVSELIHIAAEQVKKRIEVVGDAEVLLLRGNLIPLVRLTDVLGMPRKYVTPEDGELRPDRRSRIADRRSAQYGLSEQEADKKNPADNENRRANPDRRFHANSDLNIVVIMTGSLQYGLVVDQLHDTVEIVVKPLGRHLKKLREYAGATILGDGRVALILDATGLAVKEALISMAGTKRAKEVSENARNEEGRDRQAFLTFRNAPSEFVAAPLDLVARVGQIKNEQIEWVGGKRAMQYRDTALPLFTLKDVAQVAEIAPEQDKVVIVF